MGLADCDISTTNYDVVLESALESITNVTPVTAVGPNHRSPNSVLHLHGVMGPRGRIRGRLVLSERDYFLMQEDSAWQQQYFGDRLASTTCVFVGASLSPTQTY